MIWKIVMDNEKCKFLGKIILSTYDVKKLVFIWDEERISIKCNKMQEDSLSQF
jgi:hypothetical protein